MSTNKAAQRTIHSTGGGILEDEMLQPSLSFAIYDSGVETNLDILCRFYLCYQVLGHTCRERCTCHQPTFEAYLERCIAAGLPSKFPPPTTCTSRPSVAWASVTAAL